MDVVETVEAVSPDRAEGHPEQAEQRLAVPDDDPDRRDVRRDRRRATWPTSPSAPARTYFSEWNRGDSITLTRNDDYWGATPYFKTVTLQVLQGPDGAQQRAADRHHQRDRHRAGARGAGPVRGQRRSTRSSRARPTARSCCRSTTRRRRCSNREGPPGRPPRHRPQGADGHLLGRPRQADRQHGPADRPVVRGPDRRLPVRPGRRPSSCSRQSGAADLTLRLRLPTLPYAIACGQVVKSQLEQVGITVELDQLEFPAAWLSTVFNERRLRHVDHRPRRAARHARRCSATRTTTPRYDNPEFQALLAKADAGHAGGADRRHAGGGPDAVARTPRPTGCSCCRT